MENKQSSIDFSLRLIEGKIAELVFSQMFRNSNKFTVIPFGYENNYPEIAQYANMANDTQVLETIRSAPDFALVSHDKKDVYLVEVKYRNSLNAKYVKKDAEKIQNRWESVQLFIATPDGFYFDNCNDIIASKGIISALNINWIEKKAQKEYTGLLNTFIKKSKNSNI